MIPYVKESDSLTAAILSASKDGWNVETFHDSRRAGQNKSREALLNRAYIDDSIKFIRYLDDDDLLLPHMAQVAEVFKDLSVEVVYTNAVIAMPSGTKHELTYTGNPFDDTMQVHPWIWVARKETLKRVKDVYGTVWDYDRPYREGGYLWLKFIHLGIKMRYLPVPAYQYNKSFDPMRISQHPGFIDASRDLFEELKSHHTQTQA